MIVDTSALYALLFREPDRDRFFRALASAKGNLFMSVGTQIEAHVVAQRSAITGVEDSLAALIEDYGIRFVAVTPEMGRAAIEAHRKYGRGSGHPARLNFGDCFSYALAKVLGEPLLFKGKDFGATDIETVL